MLLRRQLRRFRGHGSLLSATAAAGHSRLLVQQGTMMTVLSCSEMRAPAAVTSSSGPVESDATEEAEIVDASHCTVPLLRLCCSCCHTAGKLLCGW